VAEDRPPDTTSLLSGRWILLPTRLPLGVAADPPPDAASSRRGGGFGFTLPLSSSLLHFSGFDRGVGVGVGHGCAGGGASGGAGAGERWWAAVVEVLVLPGEGGGATRWRCRCRWWCGRQAVVVAAAAGRWARWPADLIFLCLKMPYAESQLASRHVFPERIPFGSRQRALCRPSHVMWPLPRAPSRHRLC
jgi:hypothetical protein